MELINKLIEVIKTDEKARFSFIIGVFGILLIQAVIFYLYSGVIKDIDEFADAELINEEIVKVYDVPYPPGKGRYKAIISTKNTKDQLPALLTDYKYEDKIVAGSRISKDKKSNEFTINDGNQKYVFRLRDESESRIIFMLIAFIFTTCIVIFGTIAQSIKFKIG